MWISSCRNRFRIAENNQRNNKGGNAAEKSNERKPQFIQATGPGIEPPAITAGPVKSNRINGDGKNG